MKFAVYSNKDRSIWSAVKVKKTAPSSNLDGLSFVCSVNSVSKPLAISSVKKSNISFASENSTSSKEPLLSYSPEINKVIYCDFNGVLDDFQRSLDCNESNNLRRLRNTVDLDRLYKLAKLSVDTGAKVVITSLWRKYSISFSDVFHFLRGHEDPDVWEFYKSNREHLMIHCDDSTYDLDCRTDEIALHVKENNVTHCVVFEDDHFIDERLNPIRTQSSVGLLDEHFDLAYKILS